MMDGHSVLYTGFVPDRMFHVSRFVRALRACVFFHELEAEEKGGLMLMREVSSNGLGGHAAWRRWKGFGGRTLGIS